MPMSPLPNVSVSDFIPAFDGFDSLVTIVVLLPPPPQAARRAASPVPPPTAMNLRRDTGSLTSRATALRSGEPWSNSGMVRLLLGLRFLPTTTRSHDTSDQRATTKVC